MIAGAGVVVGVGVGATGGPGCGAVASPTPSCPEQVYTSPGGKNMNFIDVTIKDLRRKTEVGSRKRLIQTVRGFGYQELGPRQIVFRVVYGRSDETAEAWTPGKGCAKTCL